MAEEKKQWDDVTQYWTDEVQEQFPQYQIANSRLEINPRTGRYGVIIRHRELGTFALFDYITNKISHAPQEWARRHAPKFEYLIENAVDKSKLTFEQIELLLGIPEELLKEWIHQESLPDVWLENLICNNIIRVGEEFQQRKSKLENEILFDLQHKK